MPTMPAGTHVAKIMSTSLGTTAKGDPQILIRFENADGQHITYYGFFSPRALPHTLKRLRVCGWDPIKYDNDVTCLHESDLLVGRKVELVVEDDEYNGKVRQRVAWINPLGVTADEARAIADRLKDAIARESGEGDIIDDVPF